MNMSPLARSLAFLKRSMLHLEIGLLALVGSMILRCTRNEAQDGPILQHALVIQRSLPSELLDRPFLRIEILQNGSCLDALVALAEELDRDLVVMSDITDCTPRLRSVGYVHGPIPARLALEIIVTQWPVMVGACQDFLVAGAYPFLEKDLDTEHTCFMNEPPDGATYLERLDVVLPLHFFSCGLIELVEFMRDYGRVPVELTSAVEQTVQNAAIYSHFASRRTTVRGLLAMIAATAGVVCHFEEKKICLDWRK